MRPLFRRRNGSCTAILSKSGSMAGFWRGFPPRKTVRAKGTMPRYAYPAVGEVLWFKEATFAGKRGPFVNSPWPPRTKPSRNGCILWRPISNPRLRTKVICLGMKCRKPEPTGTRVTDRPVSRKGPPRATRRVMRRSCSVGTKGVLRGSFTSCPRG